MVEASLKAQGAFLKLAELLIAHSHVVENLKRNVLVTIAFFEVNNVEHTMSLLQQKQGIIKLLFLNVDEGTLVQLEQYERYLV